MHVHPRKGFEFPIKLLDTVNPFLVLFSIAGLFLEYSPVKAWVIPVNQAIDLIFVLDFLIRLACHRPGEYFIKGYGWVDFLASLPGFMLLFQSTPIFAIFKFVRIGRFFKIIRVLRFLRILSFLKRMKDDSPWIQDRIMKIGITVVLVFVAGIFLLESGLKLTMEESRRALWLQSWEHSAKDPVAFADSNPNLVMYAQAGALYDAHGAALPLADYLKWVELVNSDVHWFIEVPLGSELFYPGPMASIPRDGLLVLADDLLAGHDGLMLILLTTLVALLFIIIFYLGAVFAKDMAGVHLIIDSVEADDYLLLQEEARNRSGSERLELNEGENEMDSLVKVVARLSESRGSAGVASGGLGAFDPAMADGQAATIQDNEAVLSRLDSLEDRLIRLEDNLDGQLRATVTETIRQSAPAIIRYLKKIKPD